MSECVSKDRFFITGVMGFVGRHLALRLLEQGHEVTGTDILDASDLPPGAYYQKVDVCDYEELKLAMQGHTAIFHVASLVQTRQSDAEKVWAVNHQGSLNVVRACRELSIKRLVYVSSASVVYEGCNIENGDESLPYASVSQAPYADSKIAAEKAVLDAHEKSTLHTCAIRPHVVFGPGDGRFIPALLKRAQAGRLRYGVGRGRKFSDFTYIDNLIDALVAADEYLQQENITKGQAFFITNGEPIGFWDFVDKVLVGLNQKPTKGRIPFFLAYGVATIAEIIGSLFKKSAGPEDGLTRFAIRYMCTHHYFSIQKAKELLGYEPRINIDEGIVRTLKEVRTFS